MSPPPRNLQTLDLSHGRLTASQLRSFATSSCLNLRKVELVGISGISNADLRDWLLEVGPLLETLSLSRSRFTRHHGEERAVDTAIRNMCTLKTAHFDGDVASALAIERKSRHGDSNDGSIVVDNALPREMPGLIRALECTGFAKVVCRVAVLTEEEIRIAEQRGITLLRLVGPVGLRAEPITPIVGMDEL